MHAALAWQQAGGQPVAGQGRLFLSLSPPTLFYPRHIFLTKLLYSISRAETRSRRKLQLRHVRGSSLPPQKSACVPKKKKKNAHGANIHKVLDVRHESPLSAAPPGINYARVKSRVCIARIAISIFFFFFLFFSVSFAERSKVARSASRFFTCSKSHCKRWCCNLRVSRLRA